MFSLKFRNDKLMTDFDKYFKIVYREYDFDF